MDKWQTFSFSSFISKT